MAHRTRGRHRAPSRFANTGTALSTAAKVTAVAATSGGLATAALIPATASPSSVVESVATATAGVDAGGVSTEGGAASASSLEHPAASVGAFMAPNAQLSADPSEGIFRAGDVIGDSPVVAAAAPEDGPERAAAYGELGFVGSAQPAPEPEPEPVVEEETTREQPAASRSEARDEAPVEEVEEVQQEEAAPAETETFSAEPAAAEAAPAATGGVLSVAAQYTGYRYTWGGNSPSTGFDCSGFTSFVYSQVGVTLPRTAAQQQAGLPAVSNPQPGDLVFFGYPAYHVGIYAGGGMMYDSPNPSQTTGYRPLWSGVSGYARP